jgi:hypothetical protein
VKGMSKRQTSRWDRIGKSLSKLRQALVDLRADPAPWRQEAVNKAAVSLAESLCCFLEPADGECWPAAGGRGRRSRRREVTS